MTATTKIDSVLGNLEDILPELADVYRDIHAHPELSLQERRTTSRSSRQERLR
jgi:hippurate hydrolase